MQSKITKFLGVTLLMVLMFSSQCFGAEASPGMNGDSIS